MPLCGVVPVSTRQPEPSWVNGHHVQGNPAQGATQLLGHLHAGFGHHPATRCRTAPLASAVRVSALGILDALTNPITS